MPQKLWNIELMGWKFDIVPAIFLAAAGVCMLVAWQLLAWPLWLSLLVGAAGAIALFIATIIIHGCLEWWLKNRQIRRR